MRTKAHQEDMAFLPEVPKGPTVHDIMVERDAYRRELRAMFQILDRCKLSPAQLQRVLQAKTLLNPPTCNLDKV